MLKVTVGERQPAGTKSPTQSTYTITLNTIKGDADDNTKPQQVLPQPGRARLVRDRAFHLQLHHHRERLLPVGDMVYRRHLGLPRTSGPGTREGPLRQARRCRRRPRALPNRYCSAVYQGNIAFGGRLGFTPRTWERFFYTSISTPEITLTLVQRALEVNLREYFESMVSP